MDRQDIDALLIGALYGELTPADEARLAAHLESHPADKTALDDLKTARSAVRESRIFELQTEPPQAISAVLLQEAARRAPRRAVAADGERESWFHRFVRSFAAHPAMAAAAMLVVVVGVAGTLYVRNGGDGFAEKTASSPPATVAFEASDASIASAVPAVPTAPTDNPAVAQATGAQATEGKDEGAAAGSAAQGFDVRLADRQQLDRKEAEVAKADRGKLAAPEAADAAYESKKQAVAHAGNSKKSKGYIEVTTPQQMPKEMPSNDKVADGDQFAGIAAGGGGAATGSVAGPAPGGAPAATPNTVAAAPPPPPASYKNAPAKPTAPPSKTVVAKSPAPAAQQEAPVEAQPNTDTTLIAWAKGKHAEAVRHAKAGDCAGAAQLVVVVRNSALGYYQQNMQNDRELKGCSSYIADAVNQNEERASKPKAAKRAADEAPAATSK